MYKINKEKEQEKVIWTIETKEYHLITEEGLEFIVRQQDAWEWVDYHTDLSEDGKSILKGFRKLEYTSPPNPIIEFFNNIDEHLDTYDLERKHDTDIKEK
jgi:hypothetical protein